MKLLQKIVITVFMALSLPLVAKAEDADVHAVTGLWDTAGVGDPPRFLIVDIGTCADDASKYCGEVIAAPEADDPDYFLTKLILFNLIDLGDGKFGKGKVWNPIDDNIYGGKMQLMDNGTLEVAGCIFGICQSQVWTRTPES